MNRLRKEPSVQFCRDMAYEISQIPGDTWIDKLKSAFKESDMNQTNSLTLDQWMQSRLRYLISDEYLSDVKFREFFEQIDANDDKVVRWTELVNFMSTHQAVLGLGEGEKSLVVTYLMPNEITVRRTNHASVCHRVRNITSLGQIASLSDSALILWNPLTCTPAVQFTDLDAVFLDFCYIPRIHRFAVSKKNRTIVFYDAKTGLKSEFVISTTVPPQMMLKMSIEEAKKALKSCSRRRVPLFNTPTAIESMDDESLLFIGDADGRIEVFDILIVRDSKIGLTYKRLKVENLHSATVTQINWISSYKFFVSSGMDGHIFVWKYERKTNTIRVLERIRNKNNSPITKFIFDERGKEILYITTQHSFGHWRVGTPLHVEVSTADHVTSLALYHPKDEPGYLITTNTANFFTIYAMPNLQQVDNWYMGVHHNSCAPTGSLVTGDTLFLVGAYLSAWKCEPGEGNSRTPHKRPLISLFANDTTGKIISVDERGDLIAWNMDNGRKSFAFELENKKAKLLCTGIDNECKRIVLGYDDGNVHVRGVTSGLLLSTYDPRYFHGGCHDARFLYMNGASRIVMCNGRKQVIMFDDLPGNRVSFVRNFYCLTENPVFTVILKEKFLLSIGEEKEVLMWTMAQHNPLLKIHLPNEPTLAVDLPEDPSVFLMGDVNGRVHFVSSRDGSVLSTFDAFSMRRPSPITNIFVCNDLDMVVATNIDGYVKYFGFETGELQEKAVFKAHYESVIKVVVSPSRSMLITAGRDEEIRLWSMEEPYKLIGQLGKLRKWNFEDRKTWIGSSGLEFNPDDFLADEDQNTEEEDVDIKPHTETMKRIAEPHHREPSELSFEEIMACINECEEQYYRGKVTVSKVLKSEREREQKFYEYLTHDADLSINTHLIDRKKLRRSANNWAVASVRGCEDMHSILPPLDYTLPVYD